MLTQGFIGRAAELEVLRRELGRERPSLVVVFGRRRVGKSTLLVEATHGRRTIYYQATRIAESENLALLKAEAAAVLGASPVLEALADWSGLLAYLEDRAHREASGLTLVVDEFPYLCEGNPALPSILQKFWDGVRARRVPLNLVLCGSRISFMEELLAERNPLHGRQSCEMDVGPLGTREAARFFPGWTPEQTLYGFGVFGGIPYYLDLGDPHRPLEENVRTLVLEKGAPLADEPTHVLQAELQTVTRYATILRSVADGCTNTGEIIARVRELKDASQLAPYVQKLQALRLVRIVRSLDAGERERDRRYYLDDPFLAFWYRFCLPNLSALAAGHARDVWRYSIEPRLDGHMGGVFEWVCRDWVRRHVQELLGVPAREVGQLWASDYDIDVAGTLLNGDAVYGECKWWKGPMGENVLDALLERSGRTRYGTGAPDRHLLLFSRGGFTRGLRARARAAGNVHLVGLERLVGDDGGGVRTRKRPAAGVRRKR